MQIKLIAMDLDGTLMLPDHQRVGETTRRALAACRQQGVRLALATGRTLALTEPVQALLPFLDYIVFSNGAGVWDVQNKKRIHSDPMQLADARQICAYLDSRPVYYEFYADGVPVAPARRKGMARLDGVPDSFVDELLEKVVYRDSVADALVGMTVESSISLLYRWKKTEHCARFCRPWAMWRSPPPSGAMWRPARWAPARPRPWLPCAGNWTMTRPR